ncbi:hypothetical protein INT48_009453 [Thamnidium elegans]|uniref:Uncharacterized protein n=1 Tax=Thamnidium elegans TaxID=101142 RepID=A0A8H7VMX1_9FUNG|nr:hypothetical protein INT48_009453 [Thamnidium elegans]
MENQNTLTGSPLNLSNHTENLDIKEMIREVMQEEFKRQNNNNNSSYRRNNSNYENRRYNNDYNYERRNDDEESEEEQDLYAAVRPIHPPMVQTAKITKPYSRASSSKLLPTRKGKEKELPYAKVVNVNDDMNIDVPVTEPITDHDNPQITKVQVSPTIKTVKSTKPRRKREKPSINYDIVSSVFEQNSNIPVARKEAIQSVTKIPSKVVLPIVKSTQDEQEETHDDFVTDSSDEFTEDEVSTEESSTSTDEEDYFVEDTSPNKSVSFNLVEEDLKSDLFSIEPEYIS